MWVRPRFASMEVEVEPRRSRGMTASAWLQRAQAELSALPELADARVRVQPPRIRGLRTSTGTEDLEVKVFGDDLPTLQRLGEEVEARLGKLQGLSNVETSLKETAPELRVVVDRRRAADLGLDVGEVGRTVRTAVGGSVATRLTEGDREFDVRVRFDPAKVRDAAEMASLPLFPRSGAALRLRDVAEVRESSAPQTIQRENQNRLVTVGASILPQVWSISEATEEARKALADIVLPEGYTVRFGGQQEAVDENRRVLVTVVLLAVFLVFAVMAIQYESLVNPLVIMAAIPLALVGVVLALTLTGLPMSAPVMLGVILLAGIVVNNGILLVEYFEIRRGAAPSPAGRRPRRRAAPRPADRHDRPDDDRRHAPARPEPRRGGRADEPDGGRGDRRPDALDAPDPLRRPVPLPDPLRPRRPDAAAVPGGRCGG